MPLTFQFPGYSAGALNIPPRIEREVLPNGMIRKGFFHLPSWAAGVYAADRSSNYS